MKLPILFKKRNTLLISSLLSLYTLYCFPEDVNTTKEMTPKEFDEVAYNWSRTFAESLNLIKAKHYDPLPHLESGITKAIDALLSELDPHSGCLDPKAYQHITESTSGSFFGIGVVIDNTRSKKDKHLMVTETLPDGPAFKAGVQGKDKIVEIEGEPLEGMTTEEAMARLKGKQDTKVTIKVLRGAKNDLLAFTITRDVIKERNSLCFYLTDQNIYYISLNMFNEQAINQIKQLLQESRKKKYKGLILDLRNNSGGLLTSAINIAGLFLPKNSLVVTMRDKKNSTLEKYNTAGNPVRTDKMPPVFILINNYTASAAEILAGCLHIHAEQETSKNPLMVFLVGTKTFGKGSVQEIIPISNNCALKVTTSLYYLPNDTSVQGAGIEPDFMIEKLTEVPEQVSWFKKHYGTEKALSNYIKPIGYKEDKTSKKDTAKKDDNEKKWNERVKEMLLADNQFRAAIRLINILDNAQQNSPSLVANVKKARTFLKGLYPTDEAIDMTEIKV